MRENPAMIEDRAAPREGGAPEVSLLLADRLRARVGRLPFDAFALLVRRLLIEMGYSEVRVRRLRFLGHNASQGTGGWDMEAAWETGLARKTLIVQIRRYSRGRTVQLRNVDELRGARLRAGADHALLVATGAFSAPATDAAGDDLTMLDGERLSRLLAEARVGICQGANGRWEVDEDLLGRLGWRAAPPTSRTDAPLGPATSRADAPITPAQAERPPADASAQTRRRGRPVTVVVTVAP